MGLTRPRAHQLQETSFKFACRAISTSNVTLSGGAPATVDGVSLSQGDRVLVIGQTNKAQNGIYNVATVGTGSNGTWNRTKDADDANDITAGTQVSVTEGTTYGDTVWKLTTDGTITIGTTDQDWEQASAYGFGTVTVDGTGLVADTVGDTLTITAGNSITLLGNATTDTFSVALSNDPTLVGTVSVTGNIIPTANVTYDLGNATNRFNEIFLAGGTINLGTITIKDDGGTMGVFAADGTTPASLGNTSTVTASGNIETTGGFFVGDGSQLSNLPDAGNAFTTISVAGQSNIVADSSSDTLTFTAGTGITLTTDASTDTLTITAASADFPFAQDGDFESVTDDPASTTEDLGDLASTNEVTYDLGTIISAEGLIYPGQLVLPQYATASLPDATVEGQLAYDTDTNSVKFTDGTQWNGYAGTASPTFTGTAAFASITASGTAVVTGNITGGNLTTAGTMTAGTIVETSTMRIKENINPIINGLDAILNLTGVTYDRKDTRAHEAGLIAEQVNEILPDLVAKDDQGNPAAIQYTKLTAYLIEAVKSLKAEIDEIKRKH